MDDDSNEEEQQPRMAMTLHNYGGFLRLLRSNSNFMQTIISTVWYNGNGGIQDQNQELPQHQHLLIFFLICFAYFLLVQTWITPLLLATFISFQYRRYKYDTTLQDLNSKWKRHILYTSTRTPLEPCEWMNRLMANMWPGYMEPKLSNMFSAMMTKRFKEKKPHIFRSIELKEFFLGTCPPSLGLQRVYWSTESDKEILQMRFEWDTTDMKILLAAKLAGPFGGMARFVINNLHIKGDLRIVPILDGQAFVYSFTNSPEIRIGLAFGGGGQSLPATELPLLASWLEKLFLETMTRTLVEPQRMCFPLAAVSMKKHATGGVICVSVVSAENMYFVGSGRTQSDRRLNISSSGSSHGRINTNGSAHGGSREYTNGSGSPETGSVTRQLNTYVDVNLEGLTRSTQAMKHSGSPKWNETFHMVLHENVGTIRFNIYQQLSSNVKYDYFGTCEVKIRYVDDGSTIFWASGENNQVLADRAEGCGKEITMEIPINGFSESKLSVKLRMKEWEFKNGSRTVGDSTSLSSLQSFPSFETSTGRIIRITVVEGRNLAAKDRNGKSDPYVRLRYGKLDRKTKVIKGDLNPVWEERFEFHEIQNERLRLHCYDSDYLNDENLGSARVSMVGLEDGVRKDFWVPLEKINTGEIRLIIETCYLETDVENLQDDLTGEHAHNERVLMVTLVEARDLIAADLCGTSDPFVSLHYGSERQTTRIIQRTLHPQWNETFKFIDTGESLVLNVKDHNDLLPDKLIGNCKVEYNWLPPNKMDDKWIPLQGVKKGEIHVQLTRQRPSIQNPDMKLVKESRMIKDLLGEVRNMAAATADTHTICKRIEKIEMLEQQKACHLSRLLKEKEMLLQKVNELGEAMKEIENQT